MAFTRNVVTVFLIFTGAFLLVNRAFDLLGDGMGYPAGDAESGWDKVIVAPSKKASDESFDDYNEDLEAKKKVASGKAELGLIGDAEKSQPIQAKGMKIFTDDDQTERKQQGSMSSNGPHTKTSLKDDGSLDVNRLDTSSRPNDNDAKNENTKANDKSVSNTESMKGAVTVKPEINAESDSHEQPNGDNSGETGQVKIEGKDVSAAPTESKKDGNFGQIEEQSNKNGAENKTTYPNEPTATVETQNVSALLQDLLKRLPNLNKAEVETCLKVKVRAPRTGLTCEKHLTDVPSIYPGRLESTKRNVNHAVFMGRNVTILQDTNWGYTCNKLEILGGAIWKMNHGGEATTNILALGTVFSELAWELDLKLLSRDFPILLDCVACKNRESIATLAKCGSLVVDGEVFEVSHTVFPITNRYIVRELYWDYGPSSIGFHPSLAFNLLPREDLRRSVEKAMAGRKHLLGMHRRNMENWCYRYIGGGTQEYECHKDGQATKTINKIKEVKTEAKFAQNFYFKPLEDKYPYLMTCNYTMDAEQIAILAREWPNVFNSPDKKFEVLFTTDSNDVSGDAIFRTSPAIAKLFRSGDINPDVGCNINKHRMLFYDMYGLALSDYHMANPLSSCDVTVVHWRRILKGTSAVDTTYPQKCFNGYYTQEVNEKR